MLVVAVVLELELDAAAAGVAAGEDRRARLAGGEVTARGSLNVVEARLVDIVSGEKAGSDASLR